LLMSCRVLIGRPEAQFSRLLHGGDHTAISHAPNEVDYGSTSRRVISS